MRTTSNIAALVVIAAAIVGATTGCSHRQPDTEEQRRALLKPKDPNSALDEQRKRQLLDSDGDLIASDRMLAGVLLPRGLKLYSSFPHEWTFKAEHMPIAAIERYFEQRLFVTGGIERSLAGAVTYNMAQPKDDPKAPPVTVRIVRLNGAQDANEVYIREAVPGKPRPSEAEVEAQLSARRAHAE